MSTTISRIQDLGGTLVGLPSPDHCWAEVWDLDAPKGFPISAQTPLFDVGCCTQWVWGDRDQMDQLWHKLMSRLSGSLSDLSYPRFRASDHEASAACAVWHTEVHLSLIVATDLHGTTVSDVLKSLSVDTDLYNAVRVDPFVRSPLQPEELTDILRVISNRFEASIPSEDFSENPS